MWGGAGGREGYLKAYSSTSMANQGCSHHGEVASARPNVQKRLSLLGPKRLQQQVHSNCMNICTNTSITCVQQSQYHLATAVDTTFSQDVPLHLTTKPHQNGRPFRPHERSAT